LNERQIETAIDLLLKPFADEALSYDRGRNLYFKLLKFRFGYLDVLVGVGHFELVHQPGTYQIGLCVLVLGVLMLGDVATFLSRTSVRALLCQSPEASGSSRGMLRIARRKEASPPNA
jgi:hypothetical protein